MDFAFPNPSLSLEMQETCSCSFNVARLTIESKEGGGRREEIDRCHDKQQNECVLVAPNDAHKHMSLTSKMEAVDLLSSCLHHCKLAT